MNARLSSGIFRIPAVAVVLALLSFSTPPPATAQSAPASGPAKLPAFSLAFTERIRQETSDNITSLDDTSPVSSAYVRFRTMLMAQWRPTEDFELTVRLANENRYYLAPKSDPKLLKNYDLNEVFFDYLYLKWTPFKLPVTLTLGRQDIMLGEGFLIWDGGPLDGSRSAYFNAVRADTRLANDTALTAFYVYQPQTDRYLPRIHGVGQKMVEQDEEGFGVYIAGASGKMNYEAYLFRKNMKENATARRSGINTVGGRLRLPIASALSLTAEGALQTGLYGEVQRRAFGGYFHLDYKTRAAFPLPDQLTLGGVYLSGDDPATAGRFEAWDPAFSRWPKWSESLIYLLAREGRPAYWSNFDSLYASVFFSVSDAARLSLTWHHLGAPELTEATGILSGRGTRRGDLGNFKLTYEISKHLQGHFVWEQFFPGDYYVPGAQSYAWIRFELLFKY